MRNHKLAGRVAWPRRVRPRQSAPSVATGSASDMKLADRPRLLVVEGLQNAKEVRPVTRRDDLVNDWYTLVTWGEARFIKAR